MIQIVRTFLLGGVDGVGTQGGIAVVAVLLVDVNFVRRIFALMIILVTVRLLMGAPRRVLIAGMAA